VSGKEGSFGLEVVLGKAVSPAGKAGGSCDHRKSNSRTKCQQSLPCHPTHIKTSQIIHSSDIAQTS
jgi:hypothetical protein